MKVTKRQLRRIIKEEIMKEEYDHQDDTRHLDPDFEREAAEDEKRAAGMTPYDKGSRSMQLIDDAFEEITDVDMAIGNLMTKIGSVINQEMEAAGDKRDPYRVKEKELTSAVMLGVARAFRQKVIYKAYEALIKVPGVK